MPVNEPAQWLLEIEDAMIGLVSKGVLMAAAMTVATLGGTGLSVAGDNCVSYAKLTLQQAKQNIDKRCKFKGARWSLDVAKHIAWCKDVGPTEWREELKKRNAMLAGCKG